MPKRFVTRITERRGPEATARHPGLKAVLAVAIIVLGVAVFLEPTRTAIPSVRLAGALMLAAGLFQLTLAITAHRRDPQAHGLGIGIVNTGVGGLFLAAPQLGVTALSLVLAVAQIAAGAERGLAAWRARGDHWPWSVALGLLLVVSGTSIALGWPASGLMAIGRFVGLNLVIEGVSWLVILNRTRARPPASVTFAPSEPIAEAADRRPP